MKQLIVFTGESGSGKTTLISELVRRHPSRFRRVITCTSRAIRANETDGVDYHFLPAEYFLDNQELVLVKEATEGWYGTRKSDLFSSTHHLLLSSKPSAINKLMVIGFRNIILVRITISEELKVKRMRRRGDSEDLILDRLKSEDADRADAEKRQAQIINLDARGHIEDKLRTILRYVND